MDGIRNPLSDAACISASEVLVGHLWRGTKVEGLPAEIRPHDRLDGYRIQAHLESASAHPLFGWKIAATNPGGQAALGVGGPLAGRLIRELTLEDGGRIPLSGNVMRVAEAEFAFRMARDLFPRKEPYEVGEVMSAVADLLLAIEIPDSRFKPVSGAGAPQHIADAAVCGRFVFGGIVTADWRTGDLARAVVQLRINGAVKAEGRGANVLGGPDKALTWLVNELSSNGLALRAGQTVSTGSAVAPPPVTVGDVIEADFGELGRVAATII